jgi:hypothetical protein
MTQLIEKLKQKLQAKNKRIRRYAKTKNIQNKILEGDTKQIYRYLGAKTIEMKDHPHMEEV